VETCIKTKYTAPTWSLNALYDPYHPITFWKYNLIQYMFEYHLENGKLPPFPKKLRVSSHISPAEEESIGVELTKTMDYRSRYHLPSDITPSCSTEQESYRGDFNLDSEPDGRKRAFSALSLNDTISNAAVYQGST